MSEVKITPRTVEILQSGGIPVGTAVNVPTQALLQQRDVWKPKKVAIIGTAPSSRTQAPYNDPSWTIWGTSPGNQGLLPRIDAWLEMHCNFYWPEYRSYGEPYIRWLNEQPFPVMAQDNSMVPRATRYPIEKIMQRFFPDGKPYFLTSTFAYCMAFAIDVGVEEIGLWGVDMSSKDEYSTQRPGGHYFLMEARRAGIKVTIPPESDLDQPPALYGYVDSTPHGRKMAARDQELATRISQMETQVNQMQQQMVYLRGAREDLDYGRTIWGGIAVNGHFTNGNGPQPIPGPFPQEMTDKIREMMPHPSPGHDNTLPHPQAGGVSFPAWTVFPNLTPTKAEDERPNKQP